MERIILILSLLMSSQLILPAQSKLPVLRSNQETLSIQDGQILRQDYWTLDPRLALDIYVADKTRQIKTVSYYSDIDTLAFELAAGEMHDFIVILNEQDTFYNRVQSGVTFAKNASTNVPPDTIPFRLSQANNMIVEAVLNGQDTLQLMFHLANGNINLTEEAVQKLKSISMDGATSANSWGGQGEVRYCLNNSVQIGTKRLDSLIVWQDRFSGPETDGKFGPDFFDNQIVEIDFDRSYLVIHNQLPDMLSSYRPVSIQFDRNMMFVEAHSQIGGEKLSHRLLLHSGFGGAILLDDAFAKQHQIGQKLEITSEKELKDSFGNIVKTKEAILPSLSIGGLNLEAVPVGFFEGTIGRQQMSIVGGDVIKRFNFIIDLQGGELYLQPNSLQGVQFSSY
ncbi:MAG: hypothetical protein AB8H47_19440 [Bacteroidia bacterium]